MYSPDDDNEREDGLNEGDYAVGNKSELSAVIGKRMEQIVMAKERALIIFQLNEAEDGQEATTYIATIPKTKVNVFDLAVRYVLCGTSFRMASRMVENRDEVLVNPSIRSCPPSMVSTFVQVAKHARKIS